MEVASINGSGCPEGTAAVAVSEDNKAFTVTYSDYLAQAGKGTGATDSRKNCQVNLNVNVPQGFTYAVVGTDHRGYGSIQNGATASQRASYYFQGSSQTVRTSKNFTGPFEENWQVSDEVGVASLVWAPCGEKRNFNINTELRVDAGTSDPNSTSYITMDSTDSEVSTIFHLAWKECGATEEESA